MTRGQRQPHKHDILGLWQDVVVRRFYEEVGRRLRRARNERQLTQQVVADRVEMSRASVANIEAGRQQFPLHMLLLLAEAVEVSPADLLPTDRGLINDEPLLRDDQSIQGLSEHEKDWVLRVVGSSGGGSSR